MAKHSEIDPDEFEGAFKNLMEKMYHWELKYFERTIDDFYNDLEPGLEQAMRDELVDIFEELVLKGGSNYDRVDNLVCNTPPEYDLANDRIKVIQKDDKKFLVTIEKTIGLKSTFRLTFLKKNGKCLLAKRELQDGEKWCRLHV